METVETMERIVENLFNGSWKGLVCIGNAMATSDGEKYNEICEFLEENHIPFDYDEDYNQGGAYMIVLREE